MAVQKSALDITEIRKLILIALFSDDLLMDLLVLKGGNALAIVHRIGDRASVDLDFSIAEKLRDAEDVRQRISRALSREFSGVGYQVFDESFSPRPAEPGQSTPDWWGGYEVKFKLIRSDLAKRLGGELSDMRRQAEVIGSGQRRTYTIDISHNEYVGGKEAKELDDYIVYVYSPTMIAVEKLRAVCQQLPEYSLIAPTKKRRRARDFYDIYQVLVCDGIDLTAAENLTLIRHVFNAKRVPLQLLARVRDSRGFHAVDWPAVEASLGGAHEHFEYYFDFVVDVCEKLEILWNE